MIKFTDRFIKLPIEIVRSANENLGIKEELVRIETMHIYPFDIVTYRISFTKESKVEGVDIHLKNGDDMLINMTLEQFEKALNDFMQ